MKPLDILRGKGRKNRSNAAERPANLMEKEGIKTIQDQKSAMALGPCPPPPIPLSIRPKEQLPRLELPVDFRSSPFSKATYAPASSEVTKLRRVQAIQDMSPKRIGLTELPTELKLQIFSLLFGTRTRTMALDLHGTSLIRKNFFCLGHKRRSRNVTAILRTCRRMRDEGQDYLWDHTTFMIGIGGACPGSNQLKVSIPLHSMRHVIINVRTAIKLPLAELREVLLSFDRLKTAEVRFDLDSVEDLNRISSEWMVGIFLAAGKMEKPLKIGLVPQQWGETDLAYSLTWKDTRKEPPSPSTASEELKQQKSHP